MYKIIQICLFLVLFSGNENKIYANDLNKVDFVETISFIKDNNFDITSIYEQKFGELKNRRIGVDNGVYWFKVQLDSSALLKNSITFDFNDTSISEVSLFSNRRFLALQKREAGKTSLSIQLDKPIATNYLIKVLFKRQVHLDLAVISTEKFVQEENLGYVKSGLYYGVVCMVIILNLVFFISLKDISFLMYCFMILSRSLVLACIDGFIYFIYPNTNIDLFVGVSHVMILITTMIFVTRYFRLKQFYPISYLVSLFVLGGNVIFYILYFSTFDFVYLAIADFITLFLFFCFWIIGFLSIRFGYFAVFFVLGYSGTILMAWLYVLPVYGLSFVNISVHEVKLGSLLEMLMLTYAVSYNVKQGNKRFLEKEKELKDYLNQILRLENIIRKNSVDDSKLDWKIDNLVKDRDLTSRELEVLKLISHGYSHSKIASILSISVNTVKHHSRNLYTKLDVKGKMEINSKLLMSE